ncbi:MAG: molybdenum cofactor guanylyltransferase [Phycisphaerales bacterium]|nr:molybdenum cofactor guanylyltransferase [Phycisphaerales bacterium]
MTADERVVGVILIGGASRRMGSPKHELRYADGQRLLDRVASMLADVCAMVVTVGHAPPVDSERVHVRDRRPDGGPLAGIEAALMDYTMGPILVMPCDMPGVTPALLRRLLAAPPADVAVFRGADDDDVLPLPIRLAPSALPAVRACLDNDRRSLRDLLGDAATTFVPLDASERAAMANINTPADARAWGLERGG